MLRLQRYMFNLCMALYLMVAVPMSAQSTVSLTSSSGHPGDEVELNVMLSDAQSATALQINLPHSSYLSYVEGSAVLNAQRVPETHTLSVSDNDNVLNLYVYGTSLNTFKEGDGTFITFRMKLGNEPGTYTLTPEAILSDAAGSPLDVIAQGGAVTILSSKISLDKTAIDYGSVPIRSSYTKEVSVSNIGNEMLNVSEINSGSALFEVSPTTMIIAAGQQKTLTVQYNPQHFGNDATDITLVSDAVNGSQTIHVSAAPFSVNTLSVTGASGQSGEEVTVSVSMQNMEPIVAAQCCFTLPEALKYVEGSAALSERAPNNSHQIAGTVLGDKLSFFIHSGFNAALTGSEGELFTFRLLLDGMGGDYQLDPEDVLLSNVDGRDMTSEVSGAIIRIAAPRLACASELDFGSIPMEKTAVQRFAVTNSGESPLAIQRVEFSDPAFSLADASNLPTIAAGETSEMEICYQPSGEGEFSGVMQVYSNDPENHMQVVAINGTAYATNQIELSGMPVDGQPNQYALTVSMQNSLPVVAMQFDLHWIPAMAPVQEALSLSARASGHQAEVTKLTDDSYRVYVYSMNNNPIALGNGPVVTIIYNKVDEQAAYEHTTVTADQIILSTVEGRNCASSSTATWDVLKLSGLLGDANNDGQITVADVTCVINYLLEFDFTGFTEAQADMNQDQEITITDVVEIIHILLQQ